MNKSAQDAMGTIEEFLTQVGEDPEKQAAEAHTEAGGFQGSTTHPVKDVDDRTEEAQEGARSAENTSDAKSDDTGQGKPSVDNTAEATAKSAATGTAAEDHLQIGTSVQATGDDPSNETNSTKAIKDDDGGPEGPSKHPARTDNNELDGHKYARDLATAPLSKLAEDFKALSTEICADITNDAQAATKEAMDTCKECGKMGSMCKCADAPAAKEAGDQIDPALAQQLGFEMAGLVTGNFDKTAADSLVTKTVEEIIKQAEADADNVAAFVTNFEQEAQKQAMGEDPMGGMPGGGGADPLAAMAGGGAGGMPPGAEGMMPPGAEGGMPPGAEGGMPPGAEGGMPPGAEGGMPPGGGEDGMAQLMQALEQLGVSPEELMAALQGEGGEAGGMPPGAEGGMPPGAEGGMPPGAEGMLPPDGAGEGGGGEAPLEEEVGAMEAQASVGFAKQAISRMGAKEKRAMVGYLSEVIERSRQKKAAEAK